MLNKKSIKNILNVKHTCIDKVTMLADTSIMIDVHATKGEQCRCGICGKKSKFYDNGNEEARTWRTCDWAGHTPLYAVIPVTDVLFSLIVSSERICIIKVPTRTIKNSSRLEP